MLQAKFETGKPQNSFPGKIPTACGTYVNSWFDRAKVEI